MILISPSGRTLYHLTAEKGKKIVCTGAVRAVLAAAPDQARRQADRRGRVSTPKKLGTIKRPDGRYQVTYAGLPLYTFASDKKNGRRER